MNQKITITTDQHKARACMIINSLPLDEAHQVAIYPFEYNRTLAQNAYYWTVVREMAKEIGYSPETMHETFKEVFLVPIFLADPKMEWFRTLYKAITETSSGISIDECRKSLAKLVSTTKAKRRHMSALIDSIKQQAAELGIRLPHQEY